jgi:hypothetical protein
MKKSCKTCGATFEPKHNQQKYCAACRVVTDNDRKQYNYCACGKVKRLQSKQCQECYFGERTKHGGSLGAYLNRIKQKRAERLNRVTYTACACGKKKIDGAPYCPSCVVSRAMQRREQAMSMGMRIKSICRAPIMARKPIERIKCKCDSGEYAPRGHQCRICYALDIGAPAPSNDSALWLTATGAKI